MPTSAKVLPEELLTPPPPLVELDESSNPRSSENWAAAESGATGKLRLPSDGVEVRDSENLLALMLVGMAKLGRQIVHLLPVAVMGAIEEQNGGVVQEDGTIVLGLTFPGQTEGKFWLNVSCVS